MKKSLALLLTLLLTVSLLSGCSPKSTVEAQVSLRRETDIKVAFITDMGDIHDHGFNEDSYRGVQLFSEKKGAAYKYFQPKSEQEDDLLFAINEAIEEGYNVIVMAGHLFGRPCLKAARANPNTLFLALAVTPADMGVGQPPQNVSLIIYREEQAGFLAGYAAVADGYRDLGFLGGMAIDSVIRFGYGYVQGAEKAAANLGLTDVKIKYWYSGSFLPSDEIREKMESWYEEGTEVIFSCGGAIYESVLEAADSKDGKLIGVDIDQSYISPRFITSATKSLSNTVVMALTSAYENHMVWPGDYAGTCQSLGIADDCVGLPMETSDFKCFDQEIYDMLCKALTRDSFIVENGCDPDRHPRT